MAMLTNLADVARHAGLRVVEVDGWRTRGHGQMLDVRTITCHHTGAAPVHSLKPRLSLNTIVHGRPGLDGPLAHYYLDRDGTVYVVAAGLCWHAGVSRDVDYTNSHAIGIEAEAAGDGWSEDWPEVQMIAYATLCRALADAFNLGVSDVKGHKETCAPVGRKSDPSFSMGAFRINVATPVRRDDNDMADITDAQMDRIAAKTAALMLKSTVGTWLDKNKDKKLDQVTVAQALGMAATDAFNASMKLDTVIRTVIPKLDSLIAASTDDATTEQLLAARAEILAAVAGPVTGE
jgi:hypothetical protein